MITIACLVFGIVCQAISEPVISASVTSAVMMAILFLVGIPYFFVSATMCGFQWGTPSKTKWLRKARGMEINGLGIFDAIAAPITTWGVSSMVITMILFSGWQLQVYQPIWSGYLYFYLFFGKDSVKTIPLK